ncbi:MAG: hypothetical protein LUG90_06580, partial [Clostridiaceae bacterium]|nr:hypothetical protein [Clostridiaceae bacterium]
TPKWTFTTEHGHARHTQKRNRRATVPSISWHLNLKYQNESHDNSFPDCMDFLLYCTQKTSLQQVSALKKQLQYP